MKMTCPSCGSNGNGEPIDPKHFVHDLESQEHEDSIARSLRWFPMDLPRCHCLPYGDRPEDERFFSRFVGHEVSEVYDGVLFWSCPDCAHLFPRFEKGTTLYYKAVLIISGLREKSA